MGNTIGGLFAKNGYAVKYGSRKADGANASIVSVEDAIKHGDVVIIATPPEGGFEIAKQHAKLLSDKIVVDALNQIGFDQNGPYIMNEKSVSSRLNEHLKNDKLVKAFNSFGFEHNANPNGMSHFYCGDNAAAKKTVHSLLEDVGFTPIDMGGLRNAHALECVRFCFEKNDGDIW